MWEQHGNSNISESLISFLKAYNIYKIDYAIITHFHKDHISGIFDLEKHLENNSLKINSVIYSCDKFEYNKTNIMDNNFGEKSINFKTFKEYINKYKIKEIMVEKFDKFNINKNITIDVLNPRNNEIIKSKDKVNSNSLITCISVNKNNFLFMGDATIESEYFLINDINKLKNKEYYTYKLNNLKCIQIGHHGSNTSTSEKFLKSINVKEAVISSKKSVYNHPSDIIVNRLNLHKINTKITEKLGGTINKIM
ncbi:MAG: MBL fold metallo-hydrolase [Clostridia bacterium]